MDSQPSGTPARTPYSCRAFSVVERDGPHRPISTLECPDWAVMVGVTPWRRHGTNEVHLEAAAALERA